MRTQCKDSPLSQWLFHVDYTADVEPRSHPSTLRYSLTGLYRGLYLVPPLKSAAVSALLQRGFYLTHWLFDWFVISHCGLMFLGRSAL